MGTATGAIVSRGAGSGFRFLQRRLAEALDQVRAPDTATGATLESQRPASAEPPRLARAVVIEGDSIRRRLVPGAPEVGFAAFLDGIQASRVLIYESAVPIVHGSVAAVVRIRTDRRLTTWSHLTNARVYAPLGLLSRRAAESLADPAVDAFDTTPRRSDGEVDEEATHPLTLADVAVHAVQAHREVLEQQLAASWVEGESRPLYVDGGISGSERMSSARAAIGVVKSHRILYGDAAAVRTILALEEGERSSVFTIGSPERRRSMVASWYLRLRNAGDRDPLWGLVRVEVSPPVKAETEAIGARADQVSRWILAEVAPLSLPDSRWHTMVYGIRDCEQFLRSCQ